MAIRFILIADDDPAISKLLAGMLALCGYATETARDGDEVLVKTDSCHPDLILLDVMMPKKDGYEVLRICRPTKKRRIYPLSWLRERSIFPTG